MDILIQGASIINEGVIKQQDVYVKDGKIQKIADDLGGVPVYIPKPMRYRDYAAGRHINLPAGIHHLSGDDVGAYLRFRHDREGDIGRIKRQQSFI